MLSLCVNPIRKACPLWHYAILTICILFIYFPVFNFNFLNGWDDQWFVTNYMTKGGFTGKNMSEIFGDFYYGQYSPINQLYYTTIYTLFGYSPGIFHTSSVLIHLTNTLMVYKILSVFLKDTNMFTVELIPAVALISSILFGVHPINLEPVAWVAASKVELYAIFYLLSLVCYRNYILRGRPVYFYLMLLFFLISFGSKEQAVTLPVCLLLVDYFYGRNMKQGMVWLEKLPLFILSMALGLVTMESQQIENADFYSVAQRMPLFIYTITEYLTKCFFPINISYLYPFPFVKTQNVPLWLWVQASCTIIALYCLKKYLRKDFISFGLLFFTVHIVLVGNLLSLARYSVIADRYAYLSSIGTCLIIAGCGVRFYQYFRRKTITIVISFFYIGVLVIYSSQHIHVWQNVTTLKSRLKSTVSSRDDFKNNSK